jgi:tRNA dimethylallyltransferase
MSTELQSETNTAAVAAAGRVKVGFIVGPTGSGKTSLALSIAKHLDAEIVNADSRQLYRAMDIGTSKPSESERAAIRHFLIDIRDPDEPVDVAQFVELAREAIYHIASRGKRPLVVGGSGLYLRALRGGIFKGPPASPEIRRELEMVARERGVGSLHDQLAEIDPSAASRIQRGDLYRIVRALEVWRLTGITITAHQESHRFASREFDDLAIGLKVERAQLYENIGRRFDLMLAEGLVNEVRALLDRGYSPQKPPLSTIGYKEIAAYLRGEMTLDAAIALAKRETRRLAKRQLTWFRADPLLEWIDVTNAAEQAKARFEEFFGSTTS